MLSEIIPQVAWQFDQEESKYKPRPSLAGPEKCIRQLVMWGLEYEAQPFQGRAIMVFNDSSFHEELTADWIRKTVYQLHSEQMPVNLPAPGLGIGGYKCRICGNDVPVNHMHGHIDGIITDLLAGDFLWEHKALTTYAVRDYWYGRKIPIDYLTQSCMYYRALSLEAVKLDGGVLQIKDKNTAGLMEFVFNYNVEKDECVVLEKINHLGESYPLEERFPNIVEVSLERFREIDRCIKEKRLPDRQYERDTWQCGYCKYGQRCWDEYDEQVDGLNPETPLPDEVAHLALQYREYMKQGNAAEESKKKVRAQIEKMMVLANCKAGRGKGVKVSLRVQSRQTLDKDSTPESVLSQCVYKTSKSTVLDIREDKSNE